MGVIRSISLKLNRLTSKDSEAVVLQALKENEKTLISLNQSQLQASLDSNDVPLGTYVSINYANLKGRADVDLKLTGKFYGGFFAKTDKFPVIFSSTDDKTRKLVGKYGKNIFGLDKANVSKSNKEIVLPAFQGWLRKLLHI